MAIVALVIFGVATLLGLVAFVAWRYQRVPADRVLVVYGRLADGSGAQLFHTGGALVLPIIQGHAWLDMRPFSLEEVERLAETADGEPAIVRLSAIVAISRTPGVTENAAERLLHLPRETVAELATDLATGTAVESVGSVPMSDLRGPTLHEAAEALLSDRLRLVGLELLQLDIVAARPA